MIFDLLDMMATYVQYLSLLVSIAPDSLPLFYGDTLNVIRYFVLDLVSSFSESNRYSNPLHVVLPDWLPLDIRLQFVIVIVIAPLALATLGFLVVFSKPGYLLFVVTLSTLFCFAFGALLVANKDLYADHPQPSRTTRVTLLAVGLPLFLLLAVLCVLLIRYVGTNRRRKEQRAHEHYVLQELRQQEAKALTYDLVDREHLDVDLLAAERSRRAHKKARIGSLNVCDVCLQSLMVVCLCVGGLICIGGIPVAGMEALQGSQFMAAVGGILLAVAGLCLIWLVLSLFRKGRAIRLAVGGYLGALFLSLVMICCSSLYTVIVTTFVSIMYCDTLMCEAGSRPPHTGALFPIEEARSPSMGRIGSVSVGCSACNLDAYPQQCSAAWKDSVCSQAVKQPRLTYDARVLCSQVDGFFRTSASIMLCVYLLFVPVLQLVLACYSVDLLQRRFPLESRVVQLFTEMELFYEKVLTSKGHASFMYNAYKPSFRYYRLTFLLQKAMMALICCTTKRGANASYAWVGLMLFTIIPTIAVVCAVVLQPFTRPTETFFFPTLQSLVALFSMVVLIAERTGRRLSYGVGVLLFVLAVAVPLATLIIGTVLTLHMEQRRYNLFLLRLQLVMTKAASGNKGNASLSHSLRGSNSSRTRGMSTAGTCDASTLKHNWLERQVLRFVQWLDPEIEAGDDIALVDGAGMEEHGDDVNAYRGASRRRSDRATVVHRVRQGSGEAGAEALYEEGAIVAVGRQPTSSKTAHRFRRFTHEDQLDALDEEDEEVVGHDVNARRRQTGESTVAANSIVTNNNNNNNSWVTNTVPRRKRARAVLLVGGAAEQAEASARRHERARQREVSGQGDFILPASEEAQVASHWRRWCDLCGLCGPNGEDTADGNEDSAEGRGSSSKKRDGQLFAMRGERAVLRKQALSKLERRVAEYDTGAYVFLPEAYFLRRYYPDGTDEDGGGGEHGRFWTLFSNLLWPTIRRFSDESTPSGEANGAVCEERRQTRVEESAEASSPLNRRASAMRDAPEAAERPTSRSRTNSVLVADPNLSPSAEQEADQYSTIRSRRAHARAQRCDITDWVSASDSAFVAPSAQLEEAAISASHSVLDSYVYVVPSPRAVNPGVACADGTARPPTGTVPSAMRRRGQHCFQLSDSPSDAAVFSHHIGRLPSRAAVGGARYGSIGYTGVATVDPDSVFAGRQTTDAFLFNRHALAPRNSDVEAGGAATAAAAAGAPSPSGHFCATPTRVPITSRTSATARRRGEPSVATSAPPLEPPSPSVALLSVNRAFDGGEVRDNRPSLSMSLDSRDSETARAQRPWATDANSGESRSRDADDVDDDDTFDGDEDDARRKSMRVTCCVALKVFFLHFWHQLQEWLGIRYTQDAVLHRLQQRDGLGSHAHTLLTYPVVFKRRQAGEEVRRALASQTDARTRASTGSQRAGCDDGNTDSLLPYARPYWRMPSAAMLGAADVRGSAMPWYLRTIHAEPSLVQAGVDVHTRTERDAVPSMSLSVYGLIDRYRRMQTEDEAHAHVAAPSQPPLTSIYESTETFIIRVPDGNAADGDSEGDDAANESLVRGAPTTRTARARFVPEPAYGLAAQATHPPAPPPPAAVVSDDAFSWLGGSAATVLSDEDGDDARGSDSDDNHTRPAPATFIGGDQEAHSRRTLPHVRRPLPPASSAMVVAQNSGQAASWAEYCLFVAQETLVGFGRFWRRAERRSPVTRNGRLEEYAESVPIPPPSNQLKDAHFVELLREVLLPDVSSDDEDGRDDTSGSGTVDTNSEASGETSSSSHAGSPRQDDGNNSSNESFIFDAFPTDSPVVTPVCGGAQWTGVDAATSRRLSVALVNGPAPHLSSTRATHASTPTTQDTQDDLKMEKNDGATMAAFESSPREEQCMKASQHPRATGAGGVSQRQQGTVWQAWLTPDLKPDQAFREANGGLGNADKSIAGVQKTAATTPPGAARGGEVTEGSQWDEATAACLRLLRCQYLLRERLADVFWAQRRRLHRVQTAVDGKIDRVVHVFLGFLFVWLGLLACLCLALVLGGMLNTVDSVLVTGTHRERSDVEYQLAGYHSWEAFTLHCCCTAAENINASFPFYALDVENWLCDNGKVKERVRRDSFEDAERSGYRVRGLCGMSFLNGCVLHTSSDGSSVRVENCTVPDLADYELERW